VNFVIADLAAAGTFLRALGVDLGPELEDWNAHHVTVAGNSGDVDADLDSAAFAAFWGGVPADLAPGAVLNLDVDDRDDVDRLHARALELGATELKAPWDAFWGARYSVVFAPGPLAVGFMSPMDPDRRTEGPEVTDFA
jgi:predicted lactoylglutathione lyase